MDSLLDRGVESSVLKGSDLLVIVGKGLRSADDPVLLPTVQGLFHEYGIQAKIEPTNAGRLLVDRRSLQGFVSGRSWR